MCELLYDVSHLLREMERLPNATQFLCAYSLVLLSLPKPKKGRFQAILELLSELLSNPPPL